MTANANVILGPHSLECGLYVKLVQFIHFVDRGQNSREVDLENNAILIQRSVEGLFRSSAK